MNMAMKIFGLGLLLIFNTANTENIRIPIKPGSNGAVIFDTNISNDESDHQMSSVVGGFTSKSGHRANATVNIKRGDGTINYSHKNSKGIVTFDTNISNDRTGSLMNSVGGGFTSTRGHRANATVNIKKGNGKINYTHKISNGAITFDTNFSNDGTGPQMNSVGGGFSGTSGHGVSATIDTTGSGGAINYMHTNNRTKLKFSSGLSVNNGNHGANIGVQIPFGAK